MQDFTEIRLIDQTRKNDGWILFSKNGTIYAKRIATKSVFKILPGMTIPGDLNVSGNLTVGGTSSFYDNIMLYDNATVWDDMKFTADRVSKGVGLSKPDLDVVEGTILFDPSSEEEVYFGDQISHRTKLISELGPHVHWQRTQAGEVLFKLGYKIWANGSAKPGSWTYIQSIGEVFGYTSYPFEEITYFPHIEFGQGISAICKFRMIRDVTQEDHSYNVDCIVDEIDVHVEYDSFGSNTEYEK